MRKIVAVTACPTGIAHTYMAAEMLEVTAERMHVLIKVETQGAMGTENELNDFEIQNADGVIIAADVKVDKTRFLGKKIIETTTSEAIHNPESIIKKILEK